MKERRSSEHSLVRRKLVLVGDEQCGKTAMLHVLAKDSYPETYVPTVFDNYTTGLDIDNQHIELCLWDTSGSPYYDNVRPLCYSDSDAVLLCFDISRPDTVDSSLKKWKNEIMDLCPSTHIILVGCKTDLRTDVCTLMELSNQKLVPISKEQGFLLAKQVGADVYLECSAFTSEKSIHNAFRSATASCLKKTQLPVSPRPAHRKGILHRTNRTELLRSSFSRERSKSCTIM